MVDARLGHPGRENGGIDFMPLNSFIFSISLASRLDIPVERALCGVVDNPIRAEVKARRRPRWREVKDEGHFVGNGHTRRVVPRNDKLGDGSILQACKR